MATPGDFEADIWKSIALSEIRRCDILVTAARSTRATQEAIVDYAELINAEQAWIQKRKVKEGIDEAKEAKAQELKDRIDAFIKAHP